MSLLGNVVAVGQIGIQAIATKPQRGMSSMDGLSPQSIIKSQITIEEVHSDEMEITDHPIEQGATISDHAFARPSEVIITMAWPYAFSDTGIVNQIMGAAANSSPVLQKVIGAASLVSGIATAINSGPALPVVAYNILIGVYNARRLFKVYTGKRVYSNMLIKSLVTTTDAKTENSLIIRVTCRQILMAQTQTVTVPDSSVMANPAKNGATVNKGVQYPLPSATYNVG